MESKSTASVNSTEEINLFQLRLNSTEEINLFQLRPLEYPSRLQEIEDMDLKPSPDEIRLMEQIQRNLWVLPAETNDDNSEWTSRKTDTEFDLFGTKLDKPTDTSSPDELTKRLQALKTDIEYRAPHLSFEEQIALLDAPEVPRARQFYRHYKGNVYMVDLIAIKTNTNMVTVIYHQMESRVSNRRVVTWERSVAEWNEMMEHNGSHIRRFTLI